MQIANLRAATQADHAAVEASLSLLSGDLTRSAYISTLDRLYGFVAAWECVAETAAPASVKDLVRARSRRALLAADVTYLTGVPPNTSLAPMPPFHSAAELFGALYVMEGSRLGGQLISRHIQRHFNFPDERGSSYFSGFGERTGSMWKEVVAVLEASISADQEALTIHSAKAMFQAFGAWMSGEPSHLDAVHTDALGGFLHG